MLVAASGLATIVVVAYLFILLYRSSYIDKD